MNVKYYKAQPQQHSGVASNRLYTYASNILAVVNADLVLPGLSI